mgnify:CR=1 FL=1
MRLTRWCWMMTRLKSMRAFSAAERLERYAYLGKGKLTAKFAAGEKLL